MSRLRSLVYSPIDLSFSYLFLPFTSAYSPTVRHETFQTLNLFGVEERINAGMIQNLKFTTPKARTASLEQNLRLIFFTPIFFVWRLLSQRH